MTVCLFLIYRNKGILMIYSDIKKIVFFVPILKLIFIHEV